MQFTGEHVVVDDDVTYTGFIYLGWCKFCGEEVYAHSDLDHWRPRFPYVITEELEIF